MAPMASKIPTFAYARSLPEPLAKKRTRPLAPPTTTRTSPNPKQRKIQHVPSDAPRAQKRAPSPIASTSPRKRVRADGAANTSHVQPLTRSQARVFEADPIDLLSAPEAPARESSRSVSGLGFSPEGSRLMGQEEPDISSGGLYSDISDEDTRVGITPTPRMATRSRPSGSATKETTPRRQSTTSTRRPSSTTKSRATPRTQPTRRQSTTPTPQRRTQPKTLPPPEIILTAAQARKEAAARGAAAEEATRAEAQSAARIEAHASTSQPEAQMSAQARREARLAAAQAEAEARLRASADSDVGDGGLGGLSLIGEEEEPDEEEGEPEGDVDELEEEAEEAEGEVAESEEEIEEPEEDGNETTRSLHVEEDDEEDPLASAPVLDTSHSSRHSPTTTPRSTRPTPRLTRSTRKTTPSRSTPSRTTTPRTTVKSTTPRTATESTTPRTAAKSTTPRTAKSSNKSRVRWTPRSESPEEPGSEAGEFSEYESPERSRVPARDGLRRSLRSRKSDVSGTGEGEGDESIAASVRARRRSSGQSERTEGVGQRSVEEEEEMEGNETFGEGDETVGQTSRDGNESAWEGRTRRDETNASMASRANTSMASRTNASMSRGNASRSGPTSPPILGHSVSPGPILGHSVLPFPDLEEPPSGVQDGGSTPPPPPRSIFGSYHLGKPTSGHESSFTSARAQSSFTSTRSRSTFPQTSPVRTPLNPGGSKSPVRVEVVIPVRRKSSLQKAGDGDRPRAVSGGDRSRVVSGGDVSRRTMVGDTTRADTTQRTHVGDTTRGTHARDATQRTHAGNTTQRTHAGSTTQRTQAGNTTQTALAQDTTIRSSTANRTLQQPTPEFSSLDRSRSTELEVPRDKSGEVAEEMSPIETSLEPSSYHPSTDTVGHDGLLLIDGVYMTADGRWRSSSGRYIPEDGVVKGWSARKSHAQEGGQEGGEEGQQSPVQEEETSARDEPEERQDQEAETTSIQKKALSTSVRGDNTQISPNRAGNWTITSEMVATSVEAAGQLVSGLANIFLFQSTLPESGPDTTQQADTPQKRRRSAGGKSTVHRDSSISLGEWRPNYSRRGRGPGKKTLLRIEGAGQDEHAHRDSSLSLGAWQPNYSRRGRNSGLKTTPAGNTSRQSARAETGGDENAVDQDAPRAEPADPSGGNPPRFGPELSQFSYTPRAGFESTPRAGYDFTPGSDFGPIPDSTLGSVSRSMFGSASQPKFGPTAASTPFVRGERPSLGLASFANLNLDGEPDVRIPYHLKGKARAVDGQDGSEMGAEIPDSMSLNTSGRALESHRKSVEDQSEVVEESVLSSPISPIPDTHLDREVSVDESVAVEMGSPGRSLRTERAPTPRALRVRTSDSEEEDDDEDAPPSPSAGRQSFDERTAQSINGRRLSDILQLRKQARDRSGPSDEPRSNSMGFPGTTTQLDAQAQEVLQSSSSHSGVHSMSPLEVRRPGTSETSVDSGEHSASNKPAAPAHSTSHYQDHTVSLEEHEPEPELQLSNNSRSNRSSSRHMYTPHSKSLGVMREFDASVRFDGPSRVRIQRSGTPPPMIRGRRTLSGEPDSDEEDLNPEAEEQWQDEDSHDRRSSNTSVVHSSELENGAQGPEYEESDEEEEDDELDYDDDGQPIIKISGPVPVVAQAKSALLQIGYVEDTQSMERYIRRSQSRSARSRSRSRAGDDSSIRHVSTSNSNASYSRFLGDRTTGLSRSQMMAEASRYEDWEPPSRRELLPRKWTEHDWRMLAHYLRRVQKSQALERGLSSREDLDVMLVNVHAVVDRFVEEEAHGIKLQGEWDRTEIAGRAAYLIIREKEKDSSWRERLFDSASFPTIIADMTRPRAPEDETDVPADEPPTRRMLPAALAEVPGPSRQRISSGQHRVEPPNTSIGSAQNLSAEVTQETSVEQTQDVSDLVQDQSADSAQGGPSDTERRKAKVAAARQRARQLREARKLADLPPSDASRSQVSQLVPIRSAAAPSTPFAKVVGSISSFFGNRPPLQVGPLTEPGVSLPKLKPVSRNPVDLTQAGDDDEEQSRFPVLNHVPTPIRPTPARPRRQKRVEPKLDLPTLQHVSPPPEEPAPVRKTIKRVRSVKEIARNFEVMEEENRKAAEAARARIGFGRVPSGSGSAPAGARRVVSGEAPTTKTVASRNRSTAADTKPGKKVAELVPKGEVEVIEISDSETGESNDL